MMSLQDDHKSDDEDEKVAEAMEDIIPHFIKVDDYEDHFKMDNTKNCQNPDSFSHLATIEDYVPTSFIAGLQDVAFFHAATAPLPKKMIWK